MGLRLAIAGGGTGGHIVPGLHLLRYVAARSSSDGLALDDVVWFQSGRPVEHRVMAALAPGPAPVDRVVLDLEPPGGGAPSKLRLVRRTWPAVARARRALTDHGSEVLLGLGGFTTLPAVLAAWSLRIPTALIEINAAPGKATRGLAPFASRVFHAWKSTLPAGSGPQSKHVLLGPPLGPECFLEPGPTEPERPRLLVLGGSQGAGGLNRFIHDHGARLVAGGLDVLHQCGPGRADEAPARVEGLRSVEYLDDVPGALREATLVLCRGGASTLAEVAAARRPAIVVPYPHHADRHQARNAASLGAGVELVEESVLGEATCERLFTLAGKSGADERARMSAALASVVPSDAAERLYRELNDLRRRPDSSRRP